MNRPGQILLLTAAFCLIGFPAVAEGEPGAGDPVESIEVQYGPNRPLVFSTTDLTGQPIMTFSGMTLPNARLIVQGGRETGFAQANSRGFFSVRIKLHPDQANALWFWAYDEANNPSPPANVMIKQDSSPPPTPEIDDLANSTKEEEIKITGKAERGSTILVRGGAYEVWKLAGDNGRFDIIVPLRLGEVNSLVFKAIDLAYNASAEVSLEIQQTGDEQTTQFHIEIEKERKPGQ